MLGVLFKEGLTWSLVRYDGSYQGEGTLRQDCRKKGENGEKRGRGEDKKRRTHREGSHPQARKNAFPRTRPYWHPDF